MNKIKISLIGNCQAMPLGRILEKLNSNVHINTVAVVHKLASSQWHEFEEKFTTSDYIITQPISDDYRCNFVRTERIINEFGSKVKKIVNLFFSGYHPDWIYVKDTKGSIISGPLTDYHNKTILDGWRSGNSKEEILSNLNSFEYNFERYGKKISSTLDELKAREASVDVKITDYLELMAPQKQLFFSYNHPSLLILEEYAKRILFQLGLPIESDLKNMKEPLNRVILPVNICSVLEPSNSLRIKGLDYEFKNMHEVSLKNEVKEYSQEEMVSEFLNIYSVLNDYGLMDN